MPKPTKLVVHFDDGSTYEIPADGTGSIFMNEDKAKKCGHKPPYKKPPKAEETDTSSVTAAEDTTMTAMESTCYVINGMVVCP